MMKRMLPLLVCISLLMTSALAYADEPPERAASDALFNAQLALRALGYYTGSIDGTGNAATLSALEAFCEANGIASIGGIPAALFDASAVSAPNKTSDAPGSAEQASAIYGMPIPWSEVKTRLVVGEAYTVTACYSALDCKMRYIGGENHAYMTPLGDADADTLLEVFGNLHDYGKQPFVLHLGDELVAASLQTSLHSDDAGDADTDYSLYCTGSLSDIGALPDIDHNATVRIASGEAVAKPTA